jgi:hypothetical protein
MPSMRWYTASTHQKHPPPSVMDSALATFVRGSLDGFTIGFGLLAGLAVLSFASPHAAQQKRVVQLNNLRKVFICLQVNAAKPTAPLG